MIRCEDRRLVVTVPMTLANARALAEAGEQLLAAGGEWLVDLAEVGNSVDSAALAVIFSWARTAQAAGGNIRLAGVPSSLSSLSELYGVAELLPKA